MNKGDNIYGLFKIIKGEQISPEIKMGLNFVNINRLREQMLLWGGYPIPSLSHDVDYKIRWIRDYLITYILPLIIEQFNIRSIDAFEKFARLIFLNTGKLLNKNRIAQEVGVSQPTIENYIYQLRAMMIIIVLNIYHKNPRKRLIKQSKIHVIDSLLLHNAFGTGFSLKKSQELQSFGFIYESFIIMEIKKALLNAGLSFDLYYWRTQDKAEVDLIVEIKGKIIPFEIKSSLNLTNRDTTGLKSFLADNPHVKNGYIVYPGRDIIEMATNIIAIPDWWLLGCY